MNKHNIKIIGMNEDGHFSDSSLLEVILKSPLLMGGERQLGFFPDYAGKKLAIKNTAKNKLSDLIQILRSENQDAVVLASGDPMFFGIGSYIVSQLSGLDYNIEIIPETSSMQLAFARAAVSWQDSKTFSVHGRKLSGLAQRIFKENKIALLTDTENHPGKIAAYLIHFNLGNYRAFIAENLGLKNEKTGWYSLEDLSQKESSDFSDLNVMILLRDTGYIPVTGRFSPGIPDEEFSYPEKPDGLITKKEIRTLSLAAMNLHHDSVVWDIGSCTGSIAIEAGRIAVDGNIFAVEKNPEHMAHCRLNCKKFHSDISLIEGAAPESLTDLPDPDSVFIGGSGGRLTGILAICAKRLRAGGRIVVNAATLETLYETNKILCEAGFSVEITMVQISRSKFIGDLTRLQALNPVFILTACRAKSS